MTKTFLAVALLAGVFSATSSASLLDCHGISNVATQLGPGQNTCNVVANGLVFGNFSVQPSAGFLTATIGIGTIGTTVIGNTTYLDFQIAGLTPQSTNGDILLYYQVTGPINGVDQNLQATPAGNGGSVTITE